jgi:hypothetical protein
MTRPLLKNYGNGLYTGCTFRSDGPLVISLPVTRVVGSNGDGSPISIQDMKGSGVLPSTSGDQGGLFWISAHTRAYLGSAGRNDANIADADVASQLVTWILEVERDRGDLNAIRSASFDCAFCENRFGRCLTGPSFIRDFHDV